MTHHNGRRLLDDRLCADMLGAAAMATAGLNITAGVAPAEDYNHAKIYCPSF